MNTSVLILTLNEELNLPNCLASLQWCNDIVVLDSFSSDRTGELAESAGVRFVQREFDDYAMQRNFGLNEIDYKHPWVFMVDADEVVSFELAVEIEKVLSSADSEVCLFHMRRKDFFMGTWLKRSSGYPTWFGRLARIGHVTVARSINEEYLTDGKIGFLKEHLYHYPFNKGLHEWIHKHNRYSTMEAELLMERSYKNTHWRDVFSKNPTLKRKAVKSLVYQLPGRPIWMFLALYLLRGGFLDGRAGLTFCLLRGFYEFMIDCKVKEGQLRKIGSAL